MVTRFVLTVIVAAPIAYLMFDGFEPSTRVSAAAILAMGVGWFAALVLGSSSSDEPD